jgi:prepilin-type processing-associated H-X9-DG protein
MSNPLKKKPCYESQHMHPKEFALLTVCLRLTNGGKNILYFDGRNMAARFKGASKSSMYRSLNTRPNEMLTAQPTPYALRSIRTCPKQFP